MATFVEMLKLTRVETRLWKTFCEAVANADGLEIWALQKALDDIAWCKKICAFEEGRESRERRRLRAALLASARVPTGALGNVYYSAGLKTTRSHSC